MKKLNAMLTGTAIALLGASGFGCEKETAKPEAEGTAEKSPSTLEARDRALAEPSREHAGKDAKAVLADVLSAYEQLRADLAADKLQIEPAAEKLEQAASSASKLATPHEKRLQAIGKAAHELKEKAPDGASAIRKAFGELSRELVQLMEAEKALQKGLYLFECPMAEGYKRWFQPTAQIENPYMGKKMLECGSEVAWGS